MINLNRIMGKMFRLANEFMNSELEDLELSSGLVPFFRIIGEREDQTMTELSEGINTDNGYVSRTVQKLVELGYLVKNQDPIDKRVYRVNLTKKGIEAKVRVKETLEKWISVLSENVSPEEITHMEQVMEKFYQNVLKYFKTKTYGEI